ncbi:hypothetical protein GCM10023329_49460 [Streptomyces sanyensis]|uniref:Secreted protein n=1 Tax=Streptomyces sanyensis TaxID=568869 RepID=A0ABP9B9V8_9ACTN
MGTSVPGGVCAAVMVLPPYPARARDSPSVPSGGQPRAAGPRPARTAPVRAVLPPRRAPPAPCSPRAVLPPRRAFPGLRRTAPAVSRSGPRRTAAPPVAVR